MNNPFNNSSKKIVEGLNYAAVEILGKNEFVQMITSDSTLLTIIENGMCGILHLDVFLRCLMQKYPRATASGNSQRMGSVFFHFVRRKYHNKVLFEGLDFTLKPFHERAKSDLTLLFNWMQKELGFDYALQEQAGGWSVELKYASPEENESFIGYFFKGILQELFKWLDCHYSYQMKMTELFVKGHLIVTFEISYSPME